MMDGFAPVMDPPPPEVGAPSLLDWSAPPPPQPPRRGWRRVRPAAPFLLAVVLPTLLVAAYYYLIAANQFASETHFIVKSNAPESGGASAISQVLGVGSSTSQSGAHAVSDYLTSHDAVAALERGLDLVATFRRPEADFLSRLHGDAHPSPESVLKYYRAHVKVTTSSDTGITTLTVHAFRPRDALAVAETLLALGEQRVNGFNQRALNDSISVAKAQLDEAEREVAAAQSHITGFRQGERDIDPEHTSTTQITLAASLQQQLAQARAQLADMSGVDPDSPQRVAQSAQVRALEAEVGTVHARLAGGEGAMAPGLGRYEGLRLRQEFAAKHYEAAAAALESARTEALKQQMFVIRVVEPNLPVKALFPQRGKIVATVALGLLLVYAIGWLIFAGVREHAA